MATEASQSPIAITLDTPIYTGMHVSFYSAGDSEAVSYLRINHPGETGEATSTNFYLLDSNGGEIGGVHGAFSACHVVHVILDVEEQCAYMQNAAFNATILDAIKNSDANKRAWKTVVFVPYDGDVHTLSEGLVDVSVELPEVIDLTLYSYEFEIIVLGLSVTGATAYNVNIPQIHLIQDAFKDRATILLANTEKIEGGVIPQCDKFGYHLIQGWLTAGDMRTVQSGEFWSAANTVQKGFAISKTDVAVEEQYFNYIQLGSNAESSTHTYGIMFRYRPIIKG